MLDHALSVQPRNAVGATMKQRKDLSKLATMALLFAMAAGNSLSAQSPAGASSPVPAAAQPDLAAGAVKAHDDSYTIGADDVLAINVWKEPDLTRSVPVRSDGKISLPLIGEMQASGRTPLQLGGEITNRLRSYVAEPQVTVMVEQINSKKFN